MTSIQKIIKYFSLAFAVFLIVSITYGVMMLLYFLATPLGLVKSENSQELREVLCDTENIKDIKIELNKSNLEIKTGSNFKVETSGNNITCKVSNKGIVLKEKNSLTNKLPQTLIIYLPDNVNYEDVNIETDAGNLNIDNIIATKLDLELGAGQNIIKNINVYESSIETGAGELRIDNGNINNFELDMGAGKIDITSRLTGISKIETGAGYLKLNLVGDEADYKLKVETGIGKTTLAGETIKSNEVIGNGSSLVIVESGIGKVDINYLNDNR